MTEYISSITELPLDILVLIVPYLDANSFLAFCSTCKAFQQPSIRLDPSYWSHATQSAFRVPNQPVIQHDGLRWQKMYRRMLTQSRVFTWGANTYNRLGHSFQQMHVPRGARTMRRIRWTHSTHCSFPAEMERTRELGIIADMQCGGWSTTLLTSKGSLHTVGVLDGMQLLHNHSADIGLQSLRFPAGYPYSTALTMYEESCVAIRQFSSGRSHILGVSDSGRIWSWYAVHRPALHVKFLNIDVKEVSSSERVPRGSLYGRVKKVVAGWSTSSGYIYGTGIVLWEPVKRAQGEDEADTMLVMDTVEVPKTGYQRVKGASRESDQDKALGQEVGMVLNYIILEQYVVFVTDIGRVFCGRLGENNKVDEVMEVRALRNDSGTPLDVQGSFRSFAIFKNGEVLTSHQNYLEACWNDRHNNPEGTSIEGFKRIPALQHNGVISIAFGDYHFLALHSSGKITSYGTELQSCGALGLGGDGDPEGRTRGIRYTGFGHDGKLLPHAYTNGRQVWFQPEMKKWITFMTSGGKDPDEAKERMRMFVTDANVQGEVSEWFEQEGRDWDKDPALQDVDDDGLGAYFALSVSAAGWHSGALVLVNEKLADRVREKCIIKDPDVEPDPEPELSTNITEGLENDDDSPIDVVSADEDQQPPQPPPHLHDPHANFLDPISHGASPKKGYKYTWAEKPFPRLILSDGTEMPGVVKFDEWRYGRPEWQLDVDV
ncbi:uncharacterized protein BDR25DRAFT_304831 [Lindgomyces ingoldianus]|uniref:Uncharacterized protein n=1 Tax=Lindgomyces ingoldianus TaxID=673940 RepID=A0ACB6QPV6_9PLEO|nr:uncharacterized protein BDR25DRAFT_304831 [Lindgomyces ingoldianus]KAF2468902.1 hypothetical protein BDR25DRAFT_304831 [Lindgomyces ingoldianus]